MCAMGELLHFVPKIMLTRGEEAIVFEPDAPASLVPRAKETGSARTCPAVEISFDMLRTCFGCVPKSEFMVKHRTLKGRRFWGSGG